MTVKDVITTLFPPPRRKISVGQILPFAIFLVLFGGAIVYLEVSSLVQFSSPHMFFLTLLTPWIWWLSVAGRGGLGRVRGVVALMTRLILTGVLIMVMAEPRAVRRNTDLSIIYALDLSDSIGETAADRALEYVVKAQNGKPERDRVGLVVFGRDAAVELPPTMNFPFEAVNSRIARDGTDLERGLALAQACLPEDTSGRIVLISDGTATEGNLARLIDELVVRKIPVDVLPVQYAFADEVWLEKLELPRFVKAGETYEAAVVLSSLKSGSGKLVLRENDNIIHQSEIQFRAGKNRYVLPLYLRGPGYYEYVASVELPRGKDGWSENNVAINHIHLKGEGRALVVTDPEGDKRDYELLVAALKGAGRDVEVRTAYEFPHDVLPLVPYDCIILPNVPADVFDAIQLKAIRDAVFNQGIGLLMVGGPSSFGPGGYYRSPVEDALPVTMDLSQRKILPKGALVIVLHTCEFAQGNTWGKRIAKQAIRVLGPRDEAGVLIYDWNGGEKWLFKLTPAAEYKRIVTLINQAQIGDMPSFSLTMQMGLAELKASDAAAKHMIIISDGDPSPPTPALLKDFAASRISVSTISINPHGGQDVAIMRAIARSTGGRYYFPKNPKRLPSIFIREAKTLRRSMIQEKVFTPELEFPSAIMKGIDTLPPLKGLVLTTPKPRATTILKTPETEDLEPVLATWRYGVGKSAAFTSDLGPRWAHDWVQWEKYQAFVKQLVSDISRVRQPGHLHMRVLREGGKGLLLVEDHHPQGGLLEVHARVAGPRSKEQTLQLKQTGSRRYQAEFPLWGKGRYQVMVMATGQGRNEREIGGLVLPYSPEYLRFRSDPIVLEQLAEKTGGRVLGGDETGKELFGLDRTTRATSRSIVDLFLIVLTFLVPLDVAVRRLQPDWSVIKGWFGVGRRVTSTITLGALLRRKQHISFAPDDGDKDKAQPKRSPVLPMPKATAGRKPVEKITEEKPGVEEADGLSTTERLLAKKKEKWHNE